MIIIGLTGSIGMGKSTTAKLFGEEGVLIYDADQTVHDLYDGPASELVEAEFPGSVKNGKVDRTKLSKHVIGKPEAMKRLEAIVHPLVKAEEQSFLENARVNGAEIVLLDNPLLFEMGKSDHADYIVVVSAGAEIQRQRVLARSGMTEEKLNAILSKQMPDTEKRERADFVIDTSVSVEHAREQVKTILKKISGLVEQKHPIPEL